MVVKPNVKPRSMRRSSQLRASRVTFTTTSVCIGQSSRGVKTSVEPFHENSPATSGAMVTLLSADSRFMGVMNVIVTGLRRGTSVASHSGEKAMTMGARRGRRTFCTCWGREK